MDYGDGDGEVEGGGAVGEGEGVCYEDLVLWWWWWCRCFGVSRDFLVAALVLLLGPGSGVKVRRLVTPRQRDEVRAPVRGDDEEVRVDADVLAVAAPGVEADGAGREGEQEGGDEGPGLVARRGEVRGDGLVDCVDVAGFVGGGGVVVFVFCWGRGSWCWVI
ncbi:hypothetical protein CNYM01_06340 [Colletotrichum nymphaeae SA-01]|uniref:Uncharacterized protein n=1 Tax=Colletotrichum nymphaeae SA-01 TaxID=1460502 RepID=A0A135TEQ2_9PEZI|nr:hypothetical protein CNYM01_06340 [Colletotrichum nymphaeae SA-01]